MRASNEINNRTTLLTKKKSKSKDQKTSSPTALSRTISERLKSTSTPKN